MGPAARQRISKEVSFERSIFHLRGNPLSGCRSVSNCERARFPPEMREQKAVRAGAQRQQSIQSISLRHLSHRKGARDARLSGLADSDSRTVEILLQSQIVLREPAELELAHRLFPWAVHRVEERASKLVSRMKELEDGPLCSDAQKMRNGQSPSRGGVDTAACMQVRG